MRPRWGIAASNAAFTRTASKTLRATPVFRASTAAPWTNSKPALTVMIQPLVSTLIVAVRLHRRWDPRAAAAVDLAEQCWPEWALPHVVRVGFAFFHGDWEVFDREAADLDSLSQLRQVRAEMVGTAEPADAPELGFSWEDIRLGVLIPHRRVHQSIAILLHISFSADEKIATLRRQEQAASLSSIFLRLTNLIVYGRELGVNVQPWLAQLEALQNLVNAQPNLRLLSGANVAGIGIDF